MSQELQEASFDYDVFISYSRRDIVFARALEKALEDHAPSKDLPVPQRRLVVFRDEEDFTGVGYNSSVRERLKKSAKMLVTCSPHARASDFVSDEIRLFAEKRGGQNIIPVLLSGIPNNEAKKPEHEEQKAFPGACAGNYGGFHKLINYIKKQPNKISTIFWRSNYALSSY